MTSPVCARAGLATGALIGFLLQLWSYVIADCCDLAPTVGQAILAGLVFAVLAAALLAFLHALVARLHFWETFVPMLVVAMLTGIVGGILIRVVTPVIVVVLLCALLGYLLGLIACVLCRSVAAGIKGQAR